MNEIKVPKDKRLDLTVEAILPGGNLTKVADAWGISRERARQIFNKELGKKINMSAPELYSYLNNESTKFRCIYCGKPIPKQRATKGSKYCSNSCRETLHKWDVKNPEICEHCGHRFFPHRNNKWVTADNSKHYCSVECYVNSGNIGRAGSKKFKPIREIRVCIGCGEEYECKPNATRKYCSRPCFYKNYKAS